MIPSKFWWPKEIGENSGRWQTLIAFIYLLLSDYSETERLIHICFIDRNGKLFLKSFVSCTDDWFTEVEKSSAIYQSEGEISGYYQPASNEVIYYGVKKSCRLALSIFTSCGGDLESYRKMMKMSLASKKTDMLGIVKQQTIGLSNILPKSCRISLITMSRLRRNFPENFFFILFSFFAKCHF